MPIVAPSVTAPITTSAAVGGTAVFTVEPMTEPAVWLDIDPPILLPISASKPADKLVPHSTQNYYL